VIVAGLRSQLGASNRILTFVAERQLVPLVTTALFLEYEDVLNRPEQRLATGMAMEDVVGFLVVLEAAVNGRASAIVAHNVRDFLPAARYFKIEVITPNIIMLKRMRK
jgi:predicted nucleic acid-binding protein